VLSHAKAHACVIQDDFVNTICKGDTTIVNGERRIVSGTRLAVEIDERAIDDSASV